MYLLPTVPSTPGSASVALQKKPILESGSKTVPSTPGSASVALQKKPILESGSKTSHQSPECGIGEYHDISWICFEQRCTAVLHVFANLLLWPAARDLVLVRQNWYEHSEIVSSILYLQRLYYSKNAVSLKMANVSIAKNEIDSQAVFLLITRTDRILK